MKDLDVDPCRYARSEAKVTSTPVREPFYVRSRLAVPSNASLTFLALGWIAIGVYFLLPSDAQDVLYVLIGLAAVGAVLYGTNHLDRGRLAWRLFAAGLLCNVIADAISGYYEVALDSEPQPPSVVDAFYLASYPFLLAGIFLLLRDLGSVRTRVAVLDAVIVTIAAARCSGSSSSARTSTPRCSRSRGASR